MDTLFVELFKELVKIFVAISAAYILITYLFRRYSDFGEIKAHWHHLVEDKQYSVQEFYTAIEASVKAKNLPHVVIARETHPQKNMLFESREYLRLVLDDQLILVCAAHFGNGFFVSWREGRWLNIFEDLIPRIPIIGKSLARALFSKTYYEIDSSCMFVESVRNSVNDVFNGMITAKGMRPLSDAEKVYTHLS